jgi:hypothetical protein
VPGCARAQLAEILQLFDGELRVAHQVQQGIDQHRPVPGGQDEPVPVGPQRVGGVEFQMLFEQYGGDIGHAHRHPGVTGVRGSDRIQGQGADGGGFGPMVRVCFGKGVKIQGRLPYSASGLRLCIAVKGQSSSATGMGAALRINFAGQVADLKGGRICLILWLG